MSDDLNAAEAVALLIEMTCQNASKTLGIGPGDVLFAMTMMGIDTLVKSLPTTHRRLILTRMDLTRSTLRLAGAKPLREALAAHEKATNAAYDEGLAATRVRH